MSSRSSVPVIAFPESVDFRNRRTPKTLIYLTKLMYGSSGFLVMLYLFAILLVTPMLDLQFERRMEFLRLVKARLTSGIYTRITRRLKEVPNVLVKYGDKLVSDASMQTQDDDDNINNKTTGTNNGTKRVRFQDHKDDTAPIDLNTKLAKLRESLLKISLSNYETESPMDSTINEQQKVILDLKSSEMQPLNFQLKQLQTHLTMINEDIFTRNPKGYAFFQKGAIAGRGNVVVDMKKQINELREQALKNVY